MTPDDVQKLIDDSIAEAMKLATDKRCDTPTDALQVANKKYVDSQKGFIGHVAASGAGTILPTGWTSGVASTTYTITHNLAKSDYVVFITPRADANAGDPASDIVFPVIGATSSNSFNVAFFTNNGSTTKIATDFNFLLKTS